MSALWLYQRCTITRPFMTGHRISKASRPMGLLFVICETANCLAYNLLFTFMSRVQNMRIIDGKPEYKGAFVSVKITYSCFCLKGPEILFSCWMYFGNVPNLQVEVHVSCWYFSFVFCLVPMNTNKVDWNELKYKLGFVYAPCVFRMCWARWSVRRDSSLCGRASHPTMPALVLTQFSPSYFWSRSMPFILNTC